MTMQNKSINLIEGIYDIEVHTPMGIEKGALELKLENDSLSGMILNSRGASEFSDGVISGNEIQFRAKIKTPLGRLKAKIEGRVDGDDFTGIAKLPLGTAEISGKKISENIEGHE